MSKTPHSSENQAFTDSAHRLAREQVYPRLFRVPAENIFYLKADKAINEFLDTRMGIDRSMRVKYRSMPAPFLITTQERFRKPRYQDFQDITVTLWNHISDLPGEMFKLACHFFVYGFYDEKHNRLVEVIVLHAHLLVECVAMCKLTYTTQDNPRSGQTFACFKIDDLKRVGVVRLHLKDVCGVLVEQPIDEPRLF